MITEHDAPAGMSGAGAPGGPDAPAAPVSDGGTRDAIVRRLLERGPTTATELAGELRLSGAAVRRHLDALVTDGTVTTRDAPRSAGRGRGRPARQHLLTEAGRMRVGRGRDDEDHVTDLAVSVLRQLASSMGSDAIREFARERALALLGERPGEIADAGSSSARVAALAEALTHAGYAASSRPTRVSGAHAGDQLCQHHCPVARVAAEFPELCEAEAEVFAELLGTHVQRLSTIARGDAACTTHVPAPTRSGHPDRPGAGEPPPVPPSPRGPDAPTVNTASPTTTADSNVRGRQVV